MQCKRTSEKPGKLGQWFWVGHGLGSLRLRACVVSTGRFTDRHGDISSHRDLEDGTEELLLSEGVF